MQCLLEWCATGGRWSALRLDWTRAARRGAGDPAQQTSHMALACISGLSFGIGRTNKSSAGAPLAVCAAAALWLLLLPPLAAAAAAAAILEQAAKPYCNPVALVAVRRAHACAASIECLKKAFSRLGVCDRNHNV